MADQEKLIDHPGLQTKIDAAHGGEGDPHGEPGYRGRLTRSRARGSQYADGDREQDLGLAAETGSGLATVINEFDVGESHAAELPLGGTPRRSEDLVRDREVVHPSPGIIREGRAGSASRGSAGERESEQLSGGLIEEGSRTCGWGPATDFPSGANATGRDARSAGGTMPHLETRNAGSTGGRLRQDQNVRAVVEELRHGPMHDRSTAGVSEYPRLLQAEMTGADSMTPETVYADSVGGEIFRGRMTGGAPTSHGLMSFGGPEAYSRQVSYGRGQMWQTTRGGVGLRPREEIGCREPIVVPGHMEHRFRSREANHGLGRGRPTQHVRFDSRDRDTVGDDRHLAPCSPRREDWLENRPVDREDRRERQTLGERRGGGNITRHTSPARSRGPGIFSDGQRRPAMQPDRYDGSTPWLEYQAHFEFCADINGWGDEESALYLAAKLKGPAQKVLGDRRCRRGYAELTGMLSRSFGPGQHSEMYLAELRNRRRKVGETIQEMGLDIRRLGQLAYPEMDEEARDRLARMHFRDALDNQEIRVAIFQARPSTLEEAIEIATELDSYMEVEKNRAGKVSRPQARVVISQDDEIRQLREELAKLRSGQGSGGRQNFRGRDLSEVTCYGCGQKGHYRRECPHKNERSGNENASALGTQDRR